VLMVMRFNWTLTVWHKKTPVWGFGGQFKD